MNKVTKQSEDLYKKRIEQLKKVYPALFSDEGNLNEEELRGFLKQFASTSEGKYEFNWAGKMSAKRNAFTSSRAMLKPDKKRSIDFENTENLIIEGDNLEVLKLLQKSYQGKIKCIYIDPPYNTGKDYIYSDNFSEEKKAYWEKSGTTQDGVKLDTNTESQGRYHSNWLNMMYPRLLLARNLLRKDGAILISIDDTELHNLRKLCEEIYGEENFINQIVVKTKAIAGASGGGEDKRLKKNVEYLLFYSKDRDSLSYSFPERKTELMSYIADHKDKDIGFYYTRILLNKGDKNKIGEFDSNGEKVSVYQYENPKFSTIQQISNENNISEAEVYQQFLDQIFMVTNAQTSLLKKACGLTDPTQKLISYEYTPASGKDKGKLIEKFIWNKTLVVWLKDTVSIENDLIYKKEQIGTLWDNISYGRLDLEGEITFKNGKKPIDLVKQIANMFTNQGEYFLDFFAGSGTTAHAVMELNKEDGGNRKFILVQIPEKTDENSEAYKSGYKKISDICIERVKRVSKQLKKEKVQGDLGFKVFTLSPSYFPENLFAPDPEKTEEENKKALAKYIEEASTQLEFKFDEFDLMYEVLLKDGLTLNFKAEKLSEFAKNNIYKVTDGEKQAYMTLDSDLKDETLQKLQNYTGERFICLERAVDTTKKWNLQNMFGSNLWVI